MKTRKPMKFETIPEWAVCKSTRDRYSVGAAFMLAGFSNEWIRLTAESQRLVFGAVLFGKCQMRVANDGVHIQRMVCFGTDCSGTFFDWDALERQMALGCRPCL